MLWEYIYFFPSPSPPPPDFLPQSDGPPAGEIFPFFIPNYPNLLGSQCKKSSVSSSATPTLVCINNIEISAQTTITVAAVRPVQPTWWWSFQCEQVLYTVAFPSGESLPSVRLSVLCSLGRTSPRFSNSLSVRNRKSSHGFVMSSRFRMSLRNIGV